MLAQAAIPRAAMPAAANLALENILDHTNPLEVIEVRLAIEPVMARLAAFRTSQAEIKLLQALAAETRAAADPVSYEQADARFHRTIAEAARNALFLAIFDTLHASQRDVGWRRLGENAHCYKRQSVYAGFHEEISAAIAERKGDQAQELMQQHLSDVQRYIYQHAFPGAAAARRASEHALVEHVLEILAVAGAPQRLGEPPELGAVDEALAVGDLLRAADLESLARLDGLDEIRRRPVNPDAAVLESRGMPVGRDCDIELDAGVHHRPRSP